MPWKTPKEAIECKRVCAPYLCSRPYYYIYMMLQRPSYYPCTMSQVHDSNKQRRDGALQFQCLDMIKVFEWKGPDNFILFGRTDGGKSISVYLHGPESFFYVGLLDDDYDETVFKRLMDDINEIFKYTAVTDIEAICDLTTIYGYQTKSSTVIKITVLNSYHINQVIKTLRTINSRRAVAHLTQPIELFEDYVSDITRFIIETSINTSTWLEIDKNLFNLGRAKLTRSTLEISLGIDQIKIIKDRDDMSKMRVCIFDIECMPRPGFANCEPNRDPICQISHITYIYGDDLANVSKHIFCVDTCDEIEGSEVHSFDSEKKMLMGWARFFVAGDYDMISGQNIQNFDIQYLINRGLHLGMGAEFFGWGRIYGGSGGGGGEAGYWK